jgi:hypothetical protein
MIALRAIPAAAALVAMLAASAFVGLFHQA